MLIDLRTLVGTLRQAAASPGKNSAKLNTALFASLIIAGMATALLYHGILGLMGLGFPWNTFLYTPLDRYGDWTISVASAASHNPYFVKTGGAYFPFAYELMRLGDVNTAVASFAIFKLVSACLTLLGIAYFWKNSVASLPGPARDTDTWLVLLFLFLIVYASYPLWYGLDRGNIDLWLCGPCLLYVAGLRKDRSWLGAIALGAAIALKGYPLALMLLGLRQRRYLETGVSLITAVGLTIFSLSQFTSGIVLGWHGYQAQQQIFWRQLVIDLGPLSGNTDPYNALQSLGWIALHFYRQFFAPAAQHAATLQSVAAPHADLAVPAGSGKLMMSMINVRVTLAHAYVTISTIFAIISSLYVLFAPSPLWRRVTVICIVAILYPHVAGDYKLLIMFSAVFTILAQPEPGKAYTRAFWLSALLLIPQSYLYFYDRSIAMFLHPIILVCLWWTAIADWPSWRRGWQEFWPRLAWYVGLKTQGRHLTDTPEHHLSN